MSPTRFCVVSSMLLALFLAMPASATELEDIQQAEAEKIKAAGQSQSAIDATYEQTLTLLEQYRQASQEVASLKIYNTRLNQQIASQQQQLVELSTSLEQATMMERRISPLMLQMIESLAAFVELDLPFHLEERRERIALLRRNIDLANISTAEKFRQVLEAYSIEREYGRKIDSYPDVIDINGTPMAVNILRVGRIALLFETGDQQVFGHWSQTEQQWQLLDEHHYRHSIEQGLLLANKQAAVDLLTLPISAPTTGPGNQDGRQAQ